MNGSTSKIITICESWTGAYTFSGTIYFADMKLRYCEHAPNPNEIALLNLKIILEWEDYRINGNTFKNHQNSGSLNLTF